MVGPLPASALRPRIIKLSHPTLEDGQRIRSLLTGIVKANVRVFNSSIRVVVIGTRDDAHKAIIELSQHGYVGPAGRQIDDISISSLGNRHQVFIYQIAD